MSWIHFLLWVLGIYILYYLAMILWDVSRPRGGRSLVTGGPELTFSESRTPKIAADSVSADSNTSPEPRAAETGMVLPEVIASGGVLLKDVFSLARKEVIVYTRQVSFD